jgi:hypothetical protein
MGPVEILAAIFALAGVVFLLLAKRGHRLLRTLGIILILQGVLILGLALWKGF